MGKKFALSITLAAIDRATGTIRKVSNQVDKSFKKSKIAQSMKGISLAAQDLGLPKVSEKFGEVSDSAKQVGGELMKLAGIGLGVGAGIGLLTYQTGAYGAHLSELSKKVGMNSQSLQELQYAAELSGSSVDDINSGILTFSKNMGMAKAGTGKLVKFLDRVSPSLKKSLKGAKSNEEAFNLMMDAIEKVKDPQKRLALASAAFGDVGESIMLMAEDGSSGIAKLRKEARGFSFGMSDDDIKKASEFDDGFKRMTFTLKGLRNIFGAAFMPVVSKVMTDLMGYFVTNKEGVKSFAKQLADGFAQAIPPIVSALTAVKDFFMPFNEETGKAELSLGRLKLAAALAGLVIAGPLIAGIGSLILSMVGLGGAIAPLLVKIALLIAQTGVWQAMTLAFAAVGGGFTGVLAAMAMGFQALTTTMLMNPFVLIIAGIVALGFGAYMLIKHWDKVKVWFSDFWGWISEKFEKITNWTKNLFGDKTMNVKATGFGDARNIDASKAAVGNSVLKQEAAVNVTFGNLPPGAKVETKTSNGLDFGMNMKTGPMVGF